MKKVPSYIRKKFVANKVYSFLLESKITELPIDIKELCFYHDWPLHPYTSVAKHQSRSLEFVRKKLRSKDGKAYKLGTDHYEIFYDNTKPSVRQRFTIMHEIGHIVLGHLDDFNGINNSLTKYEYKILEGEANLFASLTLAPPSILQRLGFMSDAPLIRRFCNISSEASRYASERTEAQIRALFPSHMSQTLITLFHDYIHRKHCRVCKGAFISELEKPHCPYCGSKAIYWGRKSNMSKIYEGIEVDETSKALVCPICENNELQDGDFCPICSISVVNQCGKMSLDTDFHGNSWPTPCPVSLKGNYRYCPQCGGKSTFLINGLLKTWKGEYYKKLEQAEAPPPFGSEVLPDEDIPF